MAAIDPISATLESLKLAESIDYTATARKYGVSRSTLSKRHRGITGSRAQQTENARNLNTTQERELVRYIEALYKRGLPPIHQIVQNFILEIAGKEVGKNWVYRFLRRHHFELLSHYSTPIDRNRFKADSAFKYSLYFELLCRKID